MRVLFIASVATGVAIGLAIVNKIAPPVQILDEDFLTLQQWEVREREREARWREAT